MNLWKKKEQRLNINGWPTPAVQNIYTNTTAAVLTRRRKVIIFLSRDVLIRSAGVRLIYCDVFRYTLYTKGYDIPTTTFVCVFFSSQSIMEILPFEFQYPFQIIYIYINDWTMVFYSLLSTTVKTERTIYIYICTVSEYLKFVYTMIVTIAIVAKFTYRCVPI